MKDVLIIGTGGIGKRHIRGFLKTGRARVSVCEPDAAKRDAVMTDYALDQAHADIADVPLDRYDMAVVAAPAHVHVPIARTLAEAGVPFLLEKPLAVSLDGVDDLIETVRTADLTARVGFVRRVRPWIRKLKADLDSGRIGDVRMASLNGSQDFAKYRPDYQTTYYAHADMGGGAILDCASHFVDLVLWTMGSVREVAAMYDRLVLEGVECEDSLLLNLRMVSGALVNLIINQFQKPNVCTLEFMGTRGNLRVMDGEGRTEFADDDSGRWQNESFLDEAMDPQEIHESLFARQAHEFMDIVDGKPGVLCSLAEAREGLRICLAARESYRTRQIVEVAE